MACRILFTGDLHLGRRPGGLHGRLDDSGIQPSDLTPAAAWHTTVKWARQNRVTAVVLAGDVVESMNDRFEAYGHLERGVNTLVEAGIEVFAVSGNHDVFALPRLADQIAGFRLLGRDGTWDCAHLSTGNVKVDLYGWSFREKSFNHNPLDTFHCQPEEGVVSLGVLHCDLDMPGSNYAPVARRDLTEGTSLDGWFLGHIHKPSWEELTHDRPIGYVGSLSALDAGEQGPHGPWLVEVDGPGSVRAKQIPLAPIRYEREMVPIENISGESVEDIHDSTNTHLLAALERVHSPLQEEEMMPQVVACRLRLDGRSEHHRTIRQFADNQSHWPLLPHTPYCFVEKIEDGGEPALDIKRIAGESGPAAMLAGTIIALEENGDEAEELIRSASAHLASLIADAKWNDVAAALDDREEVRHLLIHSAVQSLEELLAQRGESTGGASP